MNQRPIHYEWTALTTELLASFPFPSFLFPSSFFLFSSFPSPLPFRGARGLGLSCVAFSLLALLCCLFLFVPPLFPYLELGVGLGFVVRGSPVLPFRCWLSCVAFFFSRPLFPFGLGFGFGPLSFCG